jgi:nitroimidazol reductase NimA-like FMN-containing flavoprotein (pyridoxamine 5'-phosphate oxidase superfamily)
MPREFDLGECLEMLERHRFGRLGVRDADGVYLVPIGYAVEAGFLYGHAPPGHKLQLLRMWPHVAFEVDEVEDAAHYRCVLVKGAYEEITDEEEKAAARLRLLRRFGGEVTAVTAGHGHRVHLADATLFRIRIDSLSGRGEDSYAGGAVV